MFRVSDIFYTLYLCISKRWNHAWKEFSNSTKLDYNNSTPKRLKEAFVLQVLKRSRHLSILTVSKVAGNLLTMTNDLNNFWNERGSHLRKKERNIYKKREILLKFRIFIWYKLSIYFFTTYFRAVVKKLYLNWMRHTINFGSANNVSIF